MRVHHHHRPVAGDYVRGYTVATCVFSLTKALTQRQPLATDQENAERTGKNVLCTVAKHQRPYARNQNDRHWSPQTMGHAPLHILTGFARTCVQ